MSDKTKTDNRTHAQKRIAERREAMREFLVAKGYLEQIDADLHREITMDELPSVKFKTETRLKLLAKVLPDMTENKTEMDVGGNLLSILSSLGKSAGSTSNNS